MSATMDMLDSVEQVPVKHRDDAVRSNPSKQSRPAARKHVERWSTSLDPQALRCLLAILEQQVLPRLIADYAPADRSPFGPPQS